MFFEEPKVEFIGLDMLHTTSSSTCNGNTSSLDPSGETCNGCEAPSNNCSDFYETPGTALNIPNPKVATSHSSAAKEAKTVVGFDLTFDR